MKNYVLGIGIALVFLSVFTSISGWNNKNQYLESVGAGEFAAGFARHCQKRMKRGSMGFSYGVPTVQYGCICVGVKLENQYSEETRTQSAELERAFSAYMEYLRETEMKRAVHNLDWNTGVPGNLKRAIKNSFHICDDYNLEGQKRLIMSSYPAHLKNVNDKYYLPARQP